MKILNKEYWKKVPANATTSVDIMPSDEDLNHIPIAGRVLDVGCGDGQLSEWFSKKGFSVSAIDINQNSIEACKKRDTKVDYSIQDITMKTTFKNNFFDLICFRFTLTNIHREEWPALRKEIDRLVSPKGFIWLVEPLVSDDYQERYELSSKLLNDERVIFVFKDPKIARAVVTIDQLRTAINQGAISRISRHYTKEELIGLFPALKIVQEKMIEIISPSGFKLNTFI